MKTVFDFEDQVAVITGAAQGIGFKTAQYMSRAGGRVVIADFNLSAAEEAVHEIKKEGGQAIAVGVDVSNSAAVDAMAAAALSEWGRIDILVNGAGILLDRAVVEMSDEDWEKMLDIHAGGTFRTCRAVLPAMQSRNFGRIINITSLSARQTVVRAGANYCAAKGAMVAFSRQLAQQMYHEGYDITVNCVSPGTTKTPMIAKRTPEMLAAMTKLFPLGRLGEVSDIVPAILYLCSPWGDYITGETMDINGGKYMM